MTNNYLCGIGPIQMNSGRPADSRDNDYWLINKENYSLKTFKSVQTAFSSIDLKSISDKSTFCNGLLRSKSQDHLGNGRSKISLDNERINRNLLLEEEVSEWFHMCDNKVKLNVWAVKLQKLAQKLRKPGGEEKLRSKINKYLDRIPSQLSDEDGRELRQQLPDDIIRKLKKIYLKKEKRRRSTPVNVFRLEIPKYYLHYKNDEDKTVIKCWLKNIHLMKRDFLGRAVKKDYILDYIVYKLKPVVDIAACGREYKYILHMCIMEILKKLPIVTDRCDKIKYLKSITDNLIEDLLNIVKTKNNNVTKNVSVECQLNIPDRGVQHLPMELKKFITVEISSFLEQSCIAINTKQLKRIETELANMLINSIDSIQNDNIKDEISIILQKLGRFPEYQALYFADTLYKNLKCIFYSKNHFNNLSNKSQRSHKIFSSNSKTYTVFNNQNEILRHRNNISEISTRKVTEADINVNSENYTKQLVDLIDEWLKNMDIPLAKDKAFRLVVVENLVGDIVDSHKYLQSNPNSTKTDEVKQLKYQIFNWINKLAGEDDIEKIEHAHELMQKINNLPVPVLTRPKEATYQDVSTCCPSQAFPGEQTSKQKFDIEPLTYDILDWFYELPYDFRSSEDASLNNQVITDLSKSKDKDLKLNQDPDDAIDKRVNLWNKNILKEQFQNFATEKLEEIIKNILFREDSHFEKDPRKRKVFIRRYEDIIDDWIDTISLESSGESSFVDMRNESVHELAIKVYKTKTELALTSNDIIEKKLQEIISNWIKKLPLHSQSDKMSIMHEFARKLVKNIQECKLQDSVQLKETQDDHELAVNQLKGVIVDRLKKLPINQIKDATDEQNLQRIFRNLLSKLNQNIERLSSNISPGIDKISLESEKILSRNMLPKSTVTVHNAVRNECPNLPLCLKHSPKEVRSLINQMVVEIVKLMVHPQYATIEEYKEKIKGEILKHLRGFPLKPDRQSKQNLLNMVTNLWEDIKDVHLYRDDDDLKTIKDVIAPQNIAVYGVSIQNDHRNVNRNNNTDITLQGLTEEYINKNLNVYLNQLTAQINQWLTNLQIPGVNENAFRDVVVNDLAVDIVDRHKYLELNPLSRGTHEDELKHLKYQIFKWINKLVGEENMETIEHASDLMQRIQSLSVPILVRPQDVQESQRLPSCCNPPTRVPDHTFMFNPGAGGSMTEATVHRETNKINQNPGNTSNQIISINRGQTLIDNPEPRLNKTEISQEYVQKNPSKPPSSKGQTANTNSSMNLIMVSSAGLEPPHQSTFRRMSSPGELGISNIPQNISQCKTLNEAFEFFYNAIQEKSEELPLATPTPEQKTLAQLAKRGMFNAIVMNFHHMKSDPEIGNDYGLFELILEDRLDLMLDCLPQTADMLKIRQSWKVKVIQLAIDLLKYFHKITDSQSFKREVERGIKRRVIKANLEQKSDRIMHDFIVKTANDFILYSNYKEEDPLKANIYRHRLMKKLEELAQYAKTTGNVEFRFIDRVQLCQDAFKVLKSVSIPNSEELKDEANVILLDEEIEQWYNELPVKPISSESDNVLRNRMRELLAKKIHELEKQLGIGDPSMERLIKHEISLFLHEQGNLEEDQDLNINFMVEELNNRLENRRQQRQMLGYQTFERDKPLSSTFVQPDPVEALATLVDIQNDASSNLPGPSGYQGKQIPREFETNQQGQFYQGIQGSQRIPDYLPHHSLAPVHIPNHDPNFFEPLNTPTIQVTGASSQRTALWNYCNANLQETQISGANNQKFLAVNLSRPDIRVTEASSKGFGPCSSGGQFTGSDQFLSASPGFLANPDVKSAQATTSTARICSTGLPAEPELSPERRTSGPLEELEENEEREVLECCRCIETFRRRRRQRCTCYSCEDECDCTRFHSMPFPCRYHY